MSLLGSTNSGNESMPYFIQNVGGPGAGVVDLPVIKGTTDGFVRIGNATNGLVVGGNPSGGGAVQGGSLAGSSLSLGSSVTSFQNIVLTDNMTSFNGNTTTGPVYVASGNLTIGAAPTGMTLSAAPAAIRGNGGVGATLTLGASSTSGFNIALTENLTTINTSVSIATVGADLTVNDAITLGGDLNLTNGNASGKSILGGYVGSTYLPSAQGSIPNPAGLTEGLYAVIAIPDAANTQGSQASGIFFWTNSRWFGNGVSALISQVGPVFEPNLAIYPWTAAGPTLFMAGPALAYAGPNINVVYRKLRSD